MGVRRDQAFAVVTAIPTLLQRASTSEEAIDAVAGALRIPLPSLWRASVRKVLPDEHQLEVVAVWSAVETRLPAGLRMSVLASSFPEVRGVDRPVFSAGNTSERLLVEQVMASEGVASWVTIPLHRLGRIVGLLSLSSLEPDAFAAKDVSFFEQLGLVVEERLVELMLSQL